MNQIVRRLTGISSAE